MAQRKVADAGQRDHQDRVIVIARIGIVIGESERSDVLGWPGMGWDWNRSGAT